MSCVLQKARAGLFRPTAFSGPWRGGLPEPDGRPWWPCGRGTRGDGREPGSRVEMCASSRISITSAARTRWIRGPPLFEARPLRGAGGQVNSSARPSGQSPESCCGGRDRIAQVLGGRGAQPLRPGQSPEGHRVALVRPVLREPLPPLRRLSGRRGGLGRGDRGWAKEAPPAAGHDPGSFGLKGLAARIYFAFTDPSLPTPAAAAAPPPLPRQSVMRLR